MRANSLALRLFLSATAWTVIILLVTGVVLSGVYRQTVERAFDRRLGVYLKTLIADIASPETEADKFGQLGEPLFELPLSGWYWQVSRIEGSQSGQSLVALAVGPRAAEPAGDAGADRLRRHPQGLRARARRTSACAWSSASSISATRGAICSRSAAMPPRSTTRS